MVTASHGKDTKVYCNGRLMSDYVNKISTPAKADTAEVTVFNSSGYKSFVAGKKDVTLSGEGFFDSSTSGIENYINSALGSSAVVWSWYLSGDSIGSAGYGLKAIQTDYSLDSPVDGVISMSIEGQSNVGRDRVLSLRALASASTSGTAASVDNASASTKGGTGYFQRTDNSTRGFSGTIQHSSAGASWAALVSFSSGTSKNGQRIAVSGSVKRYIRSQWTLTGSTVIPTKLHFAFSRK